MINSCLHPLIRVACIALAVIPSLAVAQNQWTTSHVAPAAALTARMCYHEADERIVALSPRNDGQELETWEWDGTRWQHRITPSPAVNQGFEMVYDAGRKVVVLFGGLNGLGQRRNDVWEWNGVRWTKRQTGLSPSARTSMGLVYDSFFKRVLMYGGDSALGRESDFWEWDGSIWTRLSAMSPSPGIKAGLLMTFDPARGVVVAFGGIGLQPSFSTDVWEFDGSAWTLRAPATRPPPSRAYAMTFDSVRNRSIVIGSDSPTAPVWEWDGVDWTARASAITPGSRLTPGVAFDAKRNQVVIHGGSSRTNTWTWDPGSAIWSRVAYEAPRPSSFAISAFNGLDRTIYFDGTETLAWNHSLRSWSIVPSVLQPSLFLLPAMTFDTRRREGVVFGALRGGAPETWIFDEASAAWQQPTPATSPQPVQLPHMAYDPVRGRTVLFGGLINGLIVDDTYEWDGVNWVQMNPATRPPARISGAMAFDPRSNRVTLFGGQDNIQNLNDVWDWDGTNWVQRITTGAQPSIRSRTAMVGRPDGLILVGGSVGITFLSEVWALRGRSWTLLRTGIPSLAMPQVIYDSVLDEVTVFGGDSIDLVPTQALFSGGIWNYGVPKALVQTLGSGCDGSVGRPQILARGLPFLGNSVFGFNLTGLPANETAALALSPSLSLSELPSGCRIYLETPLLARLSQTDAVGAVGWTLPVPALSSLVGVELFAQAAGADPAGRGLVVTEAVQLRFGR